MTALELSSLSRSFGGRRVPRRTPRIVALDAISMTLGAGQICAVLGQNGAGKTTLL